MAVPFEGAVPQGSAGLSSEAVGESALSAAEQQQEAEGGAHDGFEKVADAVCWFRKPVHSWIGGWACACEAAMHILSNPRLLQRTSRLLALVDADARSH